MVPHAFPRTVLAARAGAPGEAIYVTLKLVVTRFVPPFQGPRVEALLVPSPAAYAIWILLTAGE